MESESMEIIEVNSYNEIPENFIGMARYSDGTQYWFKNRKLHREDGPAIVWSDGTQQWYFNGKRHREDGPAVIHPDGTQYWFQNGLRHREDGPAVIWPDGRQEWFFNGETITPMELFERLSDEQKERVLWNLNQWK